MRIIATAVAVIALAACQAEGTPAEQAREQNVEAQGQMMARATAAVPVPQTTHFLARQNLAEYMGRMDDPVKVWYIYEMADTGSVLGYYVSRTYRQSVCTFMTPPEEVRHRRGTNGNTSVVVTAPALDGIYYGDGGCETVFFFDQNSDAMIFTSMRFRASDVPLDIDAPLIGVQVDTARAAD